MKLLWLIDNLGSGGAQRQLANLAILLKSKGYDTSIVCYHHSDFFVKALEDENIKIHWIIESNYFKRLIKIRRFIRNENYNVVISFLETSNILAGFASLGGKKWKLITNELSSKLSTFTSTKGRIHSWFIRFSNHHVCNSINAKTLWEKQCPQYNDKLRVIYNPVILPEINSEYTPNRNGKLQIVVAASYQYLKNPIGVINALTLMSKEERRKVEINWYGHTEVTRGNTQAYDEAIKLIKENNLQKVIHLNEPTKNIADKMNKADIVGLFSKLEGLPNAICEGMMIGKPIIMTRVSDYDVLVDDSNGILCNWDNPETIKNAILTAAQWNREELFKKGANSKKKAEILFSKKVITNQWLEIIN